MRYIANIMVVLAMWMVHGQCPSTKMSWYGTWQWLLYSLLHYTFFVKMPMNSVSVILKYSVRPAVIVRIAYAYGRITGYKFAIALKLSVFVFG